MHNAAFQIFAFHDIITILTYVTKHGFLASLCLKVIALFLSHMSFFIENYEILQFIEKISKILQE